jgi:hypothetical protein
VITPRRTRLVRVPGLHALRRAITILATDAQNDLFSVAAVVVPTRGAAHQLRRVFSGAAPDWSHETSSTMASTPGSPRRRGG